LMRVVYSHLSDEEAANRLRDVVRSDPPGGRATLTYVTRIRDGSCEYETDRAYRVLCAAINGAPPESVSPENAAFFERQRALGWSSLDEAFDQLADAVPELAQVAQMVETEPSTSDWIRHAEKLIGPRSPQSDPLLRSSLALTVVARYLGVIRRGSDHDRLRRPVWSSGAPAADP
ncbi:MAG: hypothetical protein QOF83_1947, partial [Solirubrobacteraceae bacterium]|nr:hypothetical protein [Solirubrobacteraceae bacterium]